MPIYATENVERGNSRLISYEDFSISEELYGPEALEGIEMGITEGGFFVDELIAETVSILNKKGYKTAFSCSGHLYKNDEPIKVPQSKEILKIVPDRIKHLTPENGFFKCGEDDDNLYFYYKGVCSTPQLFFERGIEIPSVPEGFVKKEEDDNFGISIFAKPVKCIIENNEYRYLTREEASNYLRKMNHNLLEWANQLTNINVDTSNKTPGTK